MEITGLPMYKRASMGIVYSSQTISLFHSLTVVENVEVAALRRLGRGVDAVDLDGYVRDILKDVGLEDFGDMEAGKLPYGSQRLLEISMALSLQPVLLILDEPTEGLSAEEMGKIMGLLRSLSGDKTLLIIEHNIRFVMELAQMVTVMADGSVIAEGRPSEVENDALIQRIYLGS
jgi:branched-chain amino acid transport system ATP-binding protein